MSEFLVVKDKVQRYARDMFNVVRLGQDGGLAIPFGSTQLFVDVYEADSSEAAVQYREKHGLPGVYVRMGAPVLREVRPSNELFRWVATDGQRYRLGSVGVYEQEDGTCTSPSSIPLSATQWIRASFGRRSSRSRPQPMDSMMNSSSASEGKGSVRMRSK